MTNDAQKAWTRWTEAGPAEGAMTDEVRPIRDMSKTACQKQGAAISELTTLAHATAELSARIVDQLEALQERIAHLESMLPSVHPNAHSAPLKSEQLSAIRNLRTEVNP